MLPVYDGEYRSIDFSRSGSLSECGTMQIVISFSFIFFFSTYSSSTYVSVKLCFRETLQYVSLTLPIYIEKNMMMNDLDSSFSNHCLYELEQRITESVYQSSQRQYWILITYLVYQMMIKRIL